MTYAFEDNLDGFVTKLKQDLEQRGFTVSKDADILAGTANPIGGMVTD